MCYCWFLFLWLLASAYMLRGSYVGCIYIYNCSVFFLDDPLIIMYYPSLSLNIYYLFIYLAARSYLQHAGSSVVACKQLWHANSCGMQDLVSWSGIKPRPPALGAQSLGQTTRKGASLVLFKIIAALHKVTSRASSCSAPAHSSWWSPLPSLCPVACSQVLPWASFPFSSGLLHMLFPLPGLLR